MVKPGVVHKSKNILGILNTKHCLFFGNTHKGMILLSFSFSGLITRNKKGIWIRKGLPFMILLVTYNAPGHPQLISTENENVHFVFLPIFCIFTCGIFTYLLIQYSCYSHWTKVSSDVPRPHIHVTYARC